MKKNGIAEIVFILDESGSMGPVRSDTIGGFNSTIQEHQGTGENIITSVILFSNEHRTLFNRVPIDEIPVMTELDYKASPAERAILSKMVLCRRIFS